MPNFSKRKVFSLVGLLIILLAFFSLTYLLQQNPIHEARAQGNTYYVPGDFATIQAAVNAAQPGDTIMVRGGTYSESLHFSRSGQSGNPITLTNYGNETVTINGGSSPTIIDYTGTEYWIIDGLNLLSSSSNATIDFDAWCDGSTCGGTHHWIIRNNYISGAVKIHGSYNLFEGNEVDGTQNPSVNAGGNGVWDFYGVSHHNVYRNNHIHHFNVRGIWSMHRTHHNVFENNYIHHIQVPGYSGGAGAMCMDMDGYGTVEWNHTIRGNVLHDCDQAAIEFENTFDSVVENNIIYNGIQQGVHVINYAQCQSGGGYGGSDCRGMMTGNIVRQNLIYNTGTEGGVVSRDGGGVKVWGNTIYGGPGTGIKFIGSSPGWEIRGNIIVGNSGGAISTGGNSLAAEDHNIFSNPRFVNPSQNDFHLQADSPAIDTGVDIGLTTDLDGNSRPQGAGYDAGVYEYGGAPRPSPTPTSTPPPSFSLSSGWNEIVWPEVSGIKASDAPPECPLAVTRQNFWFKPYVKNYGGEDFEFESGKTYYLKCNQEIVWNL